uniref:Methyltranfer_dom domain-containing protein n=1 Tax=Panagrellus redivivus TaxID=6233 RepID=A0A7E4VDM2_PANRE
MASIQSKWIGLFSFIVGFALYPVVFHPSYNGGHVITHIQSILTDVDTDGVEKLTTTTKKSVTVAPAVPVVSLMDCGNILDDNLTIPITIDKRTIEHSRKKSNKRKHRVKMTDVAEFHNILADEVLCTNLFRVGRIGDGGKWICGPQFIQNWDRKCVLYGFGINDDPSFEEEMTQITNKSCEIVAVDVNRNRQSVYRLNRIGAHYVETKLAPETTHNTTNVKDLMAKFNHTYIDILKMDIEGSEYPLEDDILELEICQMMIELHIWDTGSYSKFFKFLQKAAKAGFVLVNHEVNFMTLKCIEVTLMHTKCISRFGGVVPIANYLSLE